MSSSIFHIRERMRRKKSTNTYLDRSERKVATMCGAPVTDMDTTWNNRPKIWKKKDGHEMIPCGFCVAVQAKAGGETK